MQVATAYPRTSISPQPAFLDAPKPPPVRAPNNEAATLFMLQRGIGPEVANLYGVYQTSRYFSELGTETTAVAFPIIADGKERSTKFRALSSKAFTSSGSPPVFFGLQTVDPTEDHLIITEGEIDAMSWAQAGLKNAISLPAGAKAVDDRKGYLWNSRAYLERAKRIIIASDADEPGQACAEELARRIGKAKCWQVQYPAGCKDANDVLVQHGPEALKEVFDKAVPWPVAGLYGALHYSDQVFDLIARGEDRGVSTGLANLDEIYRIAPSKLSIFTGIPGSGKSELIDQIMVNLAEEQNWSFAICSFENRPADHLCKLLEKRVRKPRKDMTEDEVTSGLSWANNHFSFIRQDDGQDCTIESILERARVAVLRYGCRGLVIDPYNYLQRSEDKTETLWVSDMLTSVRQFAEGHGCHVWFVAHPQKLQRHGGEVPMPGGYDISGSAAWFAKADAGISVGRGQGEGITHVRSWKTRDKWLGKLGDAALAYQIETGRYADSRVFDKIEVNVPDDPF
jgi:twinkle protein